jgi:hypothetical protein
VRKANASLATALSAALLAASQNVLGQTVGSQAELWHQRPQPQKLAFLEGFCEGARGMEVSESLKLGWLTCKPITEIKPGTPKDKLFRLCGLASSDSGRGALTYLDRFYQDKDHSDVPLWAAAVTFNDRACGENNMQGRLPKLQAQWKCVRQLTMLFQSGVSQPVIDKQIEECKRYQ